MDDMMMELIAKIYGYMDDAEKPALRWRLPKRWSKTKSKLIRITVGNRWSTTLNFSTIPCEFIRQDAEDED